MQFFFKKFTNINSKYKYLSLLLGGALCVFGLAPFFIWPLYAFGILLLFIALEDAKTLQNFKTAMFWRSFIFGFGYFAFGMFWVGAAFLVDAQKFAWLMPFAITALPAFLALYYGVFGLFYGALKINSPVKILYFAAGFAFFEYLRGTLFTGIPWNLTAYIFKAGGIISQSASLIGPYGVSLLAIFCFLVPAIINQKNSKYYISFAILIIGFAFAFGAYRLTKPVEYIDNSPQIAIGQTGFTQKELWQEENKQLVVKAYFEQLASKTAKSSDIIIWPEGAFPFDVFSEMDFLVELNQLLNGKYLILGAPRADDESTQVKYYNSLAVLRGGNEKLPNLIALYDKTHLVPFGEYLPFRKFFNAIGVSSLVAYGTDFTKGAGATNIKIQGLPIFDPRICYEIIFPNFNKSIVRANMIVNVSVDAWYGDLLGPDQHYNQAKWRTIEEGIPMIRAASGGWSGIVDSFGRSIVEFRSGNRIVSGKIPKAQAQTLYSKLGNSVFFLLVVVFIAISYLWRVKK